MVYTVDEIARFIRGEVVGDGTVLIHHVTSIEEAREGSLVLAETPAYFSRAEASAAACILTGRGGVSVRKSLICAANPKAAFARILGLYHPPKKTPAGVHPSAVVGEGVVLGHAVAIGPFAVIGNRVTIGDRTVIGPGCLIGEGCLVGEETVLYGYVTLYEGTCIGSRVLIHAGAVVGSDGFGFAVEDGRQVKIPQIGIVIVEDDVEIGANACIDRATLGRTVIGRGTKIDNLVQIGHNVRLGEGSALSAQVGIGGSAVIGHGCTLGGQVGIADHVTLGDRVMVGAQSGVAPGKRVRDGEIIWGSPARPLRKSKEQFAAVGRLPESPR
jgi:UDP-3-O-[3-hydroxymyristoyl] glucosamine N-acyltransferase